MYSHIVLENNNTLLITNSDIFNIFTETDTMISEFSSYASNNITLSINTEIYSNYSVLSAMISKLLRCLLSSFSSIACSLDNINVPQITIPSNLSICSSEASSLQSLIIFILSLMQSSNRENTLCVSNSTFSCDINSIVALISLSESSSSINSSYTDKISWINRYYKANNTYNADFVYCQDNSGLILENNSVLCITGITPSIHLYSDCKEIGLFKILYPRFYKSFINVENILDPKKVDIIYKPIAYIDIKN